VSNFETVLLYAGLLFYLYGTAFAFAAVKTGDARSLARARLGALIGAFDHALVLFSFGARTGHFPITSAFEAFLFLATVVSLLALILDWYKKLAVLIVGTLPLAVVTTVLALLLPPTEASSRSPSGVWTSLHIFIALGSYGAFAIAFVTGILYLVEQRQLKQHASASVLGLMPSLEAVARVNVRAIAVGAALLAAGIVVGYLMARKIHGLGADWRDDPKIILSTVTFAVYVTVLVLSARPAFKGKRTAVASVLSFFLVMVNFWASLYWSGIHRYR
jgi:HemX protein